MFAKLLQCSLEVQQHKKLRRVLTSYNCLQEAPCKRTLGAFFMKEVDHGRAFLRQSKQTELFEQFKSSCKASGKLVPKADGVLISDELKVISRLMWNSSSQIIVGLAMDAED